MPCNEVFRCYLAVANISYPRQAGEQFIAVLMLTSHVRRDIIIEGAWLSGFGVAAKLGNISETLRSECLSQGGGRTNSNLTYTAYEAASWLGCAWLLAPVAVMR